MRTSVVLALSESETNSARARNRFFLRRRKQSISQKATLKADLRHCQVVPSWLDKYNGSDSLKLSPSFGGSILSLRIYNRHLRTSEAVANYQAQTEKFE